MNKYKVTQYVYNPFRMQEEIFINEVEASFYEIDDQNNLNFMVEKNTKDDEGKFIKFDRVASYSSGNWNKVETVYD